MEIPRWALPVAALATSGMLLLTACGGSGGGTGNAAASPGPQQDVGEDPLEDPAVNPTLEVANDPQLGKIVVNGEGQTLYRFDKDTAKPSASACNGSCAKTWPPLTTEDSAAVKGLNQDLVGKIKRSDGTWQITLGGWPLYTYKKDTDPGDIKGQGVAGTWFVSDPAGKKAGGEQVTTPPQAGNGNGNGNGNGAGTPNWSGKTVLKVVPDDKLGNIVVNGKGMTLYRFENDRPSPTVSNCYGECKRVWPPLTWTKGMKLTGVDRDLIGNYMRKDGICQVTLNGWPLYTYIEDANPGDTNGQGVKNVWFAVQPNGAKALGVGGDGGGGGY